MSQSPRKTDSQLVTFSDFSPGIVQRIGTLGAVANSPAALGSASITNTYRCISLPGGGLGPLPKNTTALSFTDRSTANLPAGVTAVATGFHIYGPLYKDSLAGTVLFPPLTSTTPFELHLGYEYVSAGSQVQVWRRYPYYAGADSSIVVNTETSSVTNIFGPTYFVTGSMNQTDPLQFGFPIVVGSWNQVRDPMENDDYCFIFPDPASTVTAQTNTPRALGSLGTIGPVISHQHRIIMLGRNQSFHGANAAIAPTNEGVSWTLPNSYTVEAGAVQFGPEAPYGYGAWGSLTSSDLLLIKHYGGAYLIQGDINNPIVRRFPSVMGTNGVEVLGAATSLGFVYGVKNDGVYAWQGGDASVLLSPQLEDGFWQAATSTYMFAGQFASWGDLILCPNNFVFDSKSSSWWKIEDTNNVYYCWQIDPFNNVAYGLKATFSDVNGTFARGYDSGSPALNFSWQSQPFSVFDRRRCKIRAAYIRAQGSGTVTLTFTSNEGAGSVVSSPNAMTVSTTGPSSVKLPMNVFGTEFTMRIVSDGGSAAPIVYEVALEVEEASNLSPS